MDDRLPESAAVTGLPLEGAEAVLDQYLSRADAAVDDDLREELLSMIQCAYRAGRNEMYAYWKEAGGECYRAARARGR